jgi:hypothetical protein
MAVVLAVRCRKSAPPEGRVLIRADGVTVTDRDLTLMLEGTDWNQLPDAQKAMLFEEWKGRVALYLAARDAGFMDRPEVRRKARLMELFFYANEYLHDVLGPVQVTDAELEAFMDSVGDLLQQEADLWVVFLEDTLTLPDVRRLMERPMSSRLRERRLQEVAGAFYQYLSGTNLGEWVLTTLPDSLWGAFRQVERGKVYGPFHLEDSWVLVRLDRVRRTTDHPFTQEHLRGFLEERKRTRRVDSLIHAFEQTYHLDTLVWTGG